MTEDPLAGYSSSLEAKTGKSLEAWALIAKGFGLEKHGEIVARLKADHGLTHGYANTITLKARESDAASIGEDALVEQMFAGPKAAIRPAYDAVMALVAELGDEVEHAPKKGYTSLRRKKQFALVQPSTKDRLDLGLILKGDPPAGRLEAAGSWNAMVTHRVRIASPTEVDGEIAVWLREAYGRAG
ncbi:DUF4287 domain-containing protein [Phenylobacterium sp. LH3H17]|uniref:DUF5655 domain-containing protein n=1 Tax=Phenylobacterium sp. LH3H17 TaxID=2903901 RepID=UPI0020CA0517|nr:DUF5655 domain-containing protein [Phenylobacterium sp. LH3H17]UTP37649.1 DUF4287 domain-containing protein [Phenylobacterium sp. LH3H17]